MAAPRSRLTTVLPLARRRKQLLAQSEKTRSCGTGSTDKYVAELRGEADEIVCLEDYEFFGAIGTYYGDFGQVSDEEVIDKLEHFSGRRAKETKERAIRKTTY